MVHVDYFINRFSISSLEETNEDVIWVEFLTPRILPAETIVYTYSPIRRNSNNIVYQMLQI